MPLTVPDQTIAAQVKVPDMLNTLSSINQIRQQQQNLQTSQLDYNIKDTANQKMNSIRDLAAGPGMIKPDGSFDSAQFSNKAMAIDPTQGALAGAGALSNTNGQTANSANLFALHKDYYSTALQTATGLLGDPRINSPDPSAYNDQEAAKALTEAHTQMLGKGVPPEQALLAVAPFMNAVHQPGAVAQMLTNTVKGVLTPQGQAGQDLIPAGQQQAVSIDSNGNPITTNRNQYGAVKSVSGVPVQGAGSGPLNVTPPNVIPQGETPQSQAALMQQRVATNTAAAQVGNQHAYNQNVVRIGSDPAFLNPNTWAASGAKVATKLGLPAGTDYQTALDMVGHNLAMATQANESAMGVSTDAGRTTAGLATGSLKMTPQAMVSAAKMNDATTSGLDAFNRGQEAAIKGANNSVFARRDFQNEWAKAYSPVVMQIYNAKKSGDTAEVNNIIRGTGYNGDPAQFAQSPQGKEIIRRAQILGALTKTGKPPMNVSQ